MGPGGVNDFLFHLCLLQRRPPQGGGCPFRENFPINLSIMVVVTCCLAGTAHPSTHTHTCLPHATAYLPHHACTHPTAACMPCKWVSFLGEQSNMLPHCLHTVVETDRGGRVGWMGHFAPCCMPWPRLAWHGQASVTAKEKE